MLLTPKAVVDAAKGRVKLMVAEEERSVRYTARIEKCTMSPTFTYLPDSVLVVEPRPMVGLQLPFSYPSNKLADPVPPRYTPPDR
jgi:hypothetical protein